MIRKKDPTFPRVTFEYAKAVGLDENEWEKALARLGREPNVLECLVLTRLWSEEFANKSSSSLLETLDESAQNVKGIPGSRIGLIDIGEGQTLALRVAQGNQESRRDAKFGMQTALDECLSDLSSAGAKPIALLPLLRFGPSDRDHNKKILARSVEGMSSFCQGTATPILSGEIFFHQLYDRTTVSNACALGVIENHAQQESSERLKAGDPVLAIGAFFGREGLPVSEENPEEKRPKISDPLMATRLVNALTEAVSQGLIANLLPLTFGGISTSTFAISTAAHTGIQISLERIPFQKDPLTPIELVLGETPNRFIAIVQKSKHRQLTDLFHHWGIESTSIGEVIDEEVVQFNWEGEEVLNIPYEFAIQQREQKSYELVKFPPMLKSVETDKKEEKKKQRKIKDEWDLLRDDDDNDLFELPTPPTTLEDTWLDILANPNLSSRKAIFERLDQKLGGDTILSGESNASLIRLRSRNGELLRGLAYTSASHSLYSSVDPYLGTVQSIAQGLRNLACVGARPVALATELNFGDPDDYKDICDLSESIRALGDTTEYWKIPILSKEVSLYNNSSGRTILPTPGFFLVGLVDELKHVAPPYFSDEGDSILLIGNTKREAGCSEYASYLFGKVNKQLPDIRFDQEEDACKLVRALVNHGLAKSAHTIGRGGLATALAECCLKRPRPIGATVKLEKSEDEIREDEYLFSETSGRFIVSASPEDKEAIIGICEEVGVPVSGIGTVGGRKVCLENAVECEISLTTAHRIWSNAMAVVLGEKVA